MDISRSCTRLYVPNKKIPDYINNNFFVEIDHFPIPISHEIIDEKKIICLHIQILLVVEKIHLVLT